MHPAGYDQDAETGGPLRILLVSAEYPPETGSGGIGTYAATLAPALAALGQPVTVLSRAPDGIDSCREEAGVRVVRVADVEPPPEFWREPFSPQRAARAAEHYRRAYTVAVTLMLRSDLGEFDVIEAPDWAGEGALLGAALPETPYVVKFHTPARLVFGWNDASVGTEFVEALDLLESVGVRGAAAWSCPSRWMGAACEKLFGLPADAVRHLPNPFDASAFEETGAKRAPREVLYLGRLESRKGVLDVVPALLRVLDAVPDATWTLAGADTNSAPGGRSVRETLLSRIPPVFRPRVRFLGHVDRAGARAALARAGVVVLPSRRENFPYACLEAMAAGAAVVGSVHGGMREMIEPGRSGLLIDPSEPRQVCEALFRVLLQPQVGARLGAAARQRAAAYAPRRVAERHLAFYRETVRNARRGAASTLR